MGGSLVSWSGLFVFLGYEVGGEWAGGSSVLMQCIGGYS